MLKLYRNILAAGVVGLGLAACGDKVTVTQPVTPTPGVTSVTVAPANLTIAVGQSVQYAVSVIADAGVATSVSWAPGNPAIATVDATGKVTGVAAGTTTIVASSTVDPTKKGIASVTVSSTPSAITSFTITPTTATLAPGNFVQISPAYTTVDGAATPTISYASSSSAIATVDPVTGKVVAVSAGTAVITATATSGSSTKTATLGVTVRALIPATISISSVTTGILTLPINLNNVAGQIEFNMNFDPGEQIIDSIAVFIGAKRAAKAFYVTNPAAGIITLSVPTNEFTKNITTGVATVSYLNGNTTFSAAIYPRGVGTATSTQVTPMVLNNVDGWVADITKPSVNATSAAGFTFWGGPTAVTSATIYPVIYTPGRSISTVTWTLGAPGGGTCSNVTQTAQPFTTTFGYMPIAGGTALTFCGYENVTAIRDNIIVSNALDNQNNTFPLVNAVTPLIANTTYLAACLPVATGCVLGSTPDSLRVDYAAPTVNTPSIARNAPAVTGWVNGAYNFVNFASFDAGVGLRAVRDRATAYDVDNCPTVGAQGNAMATGTGADIPECATNSIGGTVGLAGSAPYDVYGTESDRLGNKGTSGPSQTFGVDKTAPTIRWGTVSFTPNLPATAAADTVFFLFGTKPAIGVNEFRVEYLDVNPVTNVASGFYNAGAPDGLGVSAQLHALSTAGHFHNAGFCVTPSVNPIGAAFVTAPACTLVAIATGGPLRLDGWQAGPSITVPSPESYYGYTSNVTDAAGNTSATLFHKALVNTRTPFATGLGLPATLTAANFGILVTASDSAEVARISLQLEFPNFPGTDSVRYTQASVGTIFDDMITSPYSAGQSPTTGAPFTRRIETVNATAFALPLVSNINPAGTPVNVKPSSVVAWAFNFGGTRVGGPPPARSAIIAVPALNVTDGQDMATWNAANPTIAVNFWRVIPIVATSNQFGSIVPLRAQAVAPTNAPNPPFVRVDFYRRVTAAAVGPIVAVDHWSYLGSSTSALASDQGTYRSWVWSLNSFVPNWTGAVQGSIVGTGVLPAACTGDQIVAVGVNANGDAVVTLNTSMCAS